MGSRIGALGRSQNTRDANVLYPPRVNMPMPFKENENGKSLFTRVE